MHGPVNVKYYISTARLLVLAFILKSGKVLVGMDSEQNAVYSSDTVIKLSHHRHIFKPTSWSLKLLQIEGVGNTML